MSETSNRTCVFLKWVSVFEIIFQCSLLLNPRHRGATLSIQAKPARSKPLDQDLPLRTWGRKNQLRQDSQFGQKMRNFLADDVHPLGSCFSLVHLWDQQTYDFGQLTVRFFHMSCHFVSVHHTFYHPKKIHKSKKSWDWGFQNISPIVSLLPKLTFLSFAGLPQLPAPQGPLSWGFGHLHGELQGTRDGQGLQRHHPNLPLRPWKKITWKEKRM